MTQWKRLKKPKCMRVNSSSLAHQNLQTQLRNSIHTSEVEEKKNQEIRKPSEKF